LGCCAGEQWLSIGPDARWRRRRGGKCERSDQIRILLREILANQRDMLASLSRLEDSVAAFEMKLANLETAVSQEVARLRMTTAQRRRLLDGRRIT
jgi:hypothetical protein